MEKQSTPRHGGERTTSSYVRLEWSATWISPSYSVVKPDLGMRLLAIPASGLCLSLMEDVEYLRQLGYGEKQEGWKMGLAPWGRCDQEEKKKY